MRPIALDALKSYSPTLATLDGGPMTSEQLSEIVRLYADDLSKRVARYRRYTKESVPIMDRQYEIGGEVQTDKINNKIPADFEGEIVDIKVGYMLGNPVQTELDKEGMTEIDYAKCMEAIERFDRVNDADDKNAELLKAGTACGYSARLLYIDQRFGPMIMQPYTWDVIFVGEDSTWPDYAIRIIRDAVGNCSGYEVYDKQDCTKYSVTEGNILPIEIKPHGFTACPLIGYRNNDDYLGDFDKVVDEIDAYNRLTSDLDNELEEFRLSYLLLSGAEAPEDIEKMRQTRTIVAPEGGSASWLERHLDAGAQNSLLDRLQDCISRFAKHVNMSDEKFAGNQSGVALRQKLIPFEAKCGISQRKMTSLLRSQYMLLADYWRAAGVCNLDALALSFKFTWAVPVNVAEEATTLRTLGFQPSKETAFGLMSWIADPEAEIQRISDEQVNDSYSVNLDQVAEEQGIMPDDEDATTPEDADAGG